MSHEHPDIDVPHAKRHKSEHDIKEIPPNSISITTTAPVNIAVIKYWGKRDEQLLLPVNSSLSGTIDQGSMCSTTTIIASKSYDRDQMWLNDKEESISTSKRLQAVIAALRARAGDYVDEQGRTLISHSDWSQYHLHVISHNNFPTAAGLASSASGYACFTKCLAELYNVKESYPGELTAIARQGSGSACRSLYGGWVAWNMGKQADGRDSIAEQIVDEKWWPEIRVLILVASSGQKETSSTDGMQRTVETSDLLKYRASHVVPERMKSICDAIRARDFTTFAEITMKDSNQFHSVCSDTYPPIFYLNDTSKHIIDIISKLNTNTGSVIAAYTFDAGPNAVIYTLAPHVDKLLSLFNHYFAPIDVSQQDPSKQTSFVYDPMTLINQHHVDVTDWIQQAASKRNDKDKIYQIIVSKVGEGARVKSRTSTFSN